MAEASKDLWVPLLQPLLQHSLVSSPRIETEITVFRLSVSNGCFSFETQQQGVSKALTAMPRVEMPSTNHILLVGLVALFACPYRAKDVKNGFRFEERGSERKYEHFQ